MFLSLRVRQSTKQKFFTFFSSPPNGGSIHQSFPKKKKDGKEKSGNFSPSTLCLVCSLETKKRKRVRSSPSLPLWFRDWDLKRERETEIKRNSRFQPIFISTSPLRVKQEKKTRENKSLSLWLSLAWPFFFLWIHFMRSLFSLSMGITRGDGHFSLSSLSSLPLLSLSLFILSSFYSAGVMTPPRTSPPFFPVAIAAPSYPFSSPCRPWPRSPFVRAGRF